MARSVCRPTAWRSSTQTFPPDIHDQLDQLRDEITRYAETRAKVVITRFMPDLRQPGFFAGYRANPNDTADLCYLLTNLRKLGVESVASHRVEEMLRTLLAQINGLKHAPFTPTASRRRCSNSARSITTRSRATAPARSSKACGWPWTAPLFTTPKRASLRQLPNNYWAVLARCEFARQRLGLLRDTAILERALDRTRELLFENATGFFDNSRELSGRFDIYSPDTHLFLEPLWPLLDREKLERNLCRHVELLEAIAMETARPSRGDAPSARSRFA